MTKWPWGIHDLTWSWLGKDSHDMTRHDVSCDVMWHKDITWQGHDWMSTVMTWWDVTWHKHEPHWLQKTHMTKVGMWVDLTGSYEWTQELGPGQTFPLLWDPLKPGCWQGGSEHRNLWQHDLLGSSPITDNKDQRKLGQVFTLGSMFTEMGI